MNETEHTGIRVPAAAFACKGGWSLDTQFTESAGSPYLLAHGLGVPEIGRASCRERVSLNV